MSIVLSLKILEYLIRKTLKVKLSHKNDKKKKKNCKKKKKKKLNSDHLDVYAITDFQF